MHNWASLCVVLWGEVGRVIDISEVSLCITGPPYVLYFGERLVG